jgi:hypothetical protein
MNKIYLAAFVLSGTLFASIAPANAEKVFVSSRNGDFCVFSYEKERINLTIYNMVRTNENFIGPRAQRATITPMSDELNQQVSGPTGQWGVVIRAAFVKGTMVQLRFRNVKPGLRVVTSDNQAYTTGQCMTTLPKVPGVSITRRVINYDF